MYEFPRPGLPTLKFYWYDGYRRNPNLKGPEAWTLIRPELGRRGGEEVRREVQPTAMAGTLFVGDKGIMYCGIFGNKPHIVDPEQHKQTPVPRTEIPANRQRAGNVRQPGRLHAGVPGRQKPPCSNFPDVSGPYIEALLVGDLAMRAGVGKKLEWDGVNMKCTNYPELNQFVKPEYRPGWGL